MELLTEIIVRKTNHSRIGEVDFDNLEFGKYVSDHMLICDYKFNGSYATGWQQPYVVPFANLSLNPASLAYMNGRK